MPARTHEDLIKEARKKATTIALIYSPIELQEYIVEIISNDSQQFLEKSNRLIHFQSVDQALHHSTKHGAQEFFLCTDNTYDECGSVGFGQTFEFIPIQSKYKNNN